MFLAGMDSLNFDVGRMLIHMDNFLQESCITEHC